MEEILIPILNLVPPVVILVLTSMSVNLALSNLAEMKKETKRMKEELEIRKRNFEIRKEKFRIEKEKRGNKKNENH